jgi:hypothetical protein
MGGAIFGNYGIRRLVDQNQRFFRSGLQTWLRIKNFPDNPAFADMGFQYVPAATGDQVPTGTTDILIDPPPSVLPISMHTIAMAVAAGSELRAGARNVTLSHTWVVDQMNAAWFQNMVANNTPPLNALDPTLVFRGPLIVGIVTDNLLLEIVDYTHKDAFALPMTWFLQCNASELSQS